MRIKSVRIKNFRSFEDQTIELDQHTSLVGANGAGKSTVLCALNLFFRETQNSATDLTSLHAEDFYAKNTKDPIEITVEFTDMSKEAKMRSAAASLARLIHALSDTPVAVEARRALLRTWNRHATRARHFTNSILLRNLDERTA
ncbi:ATP-dependent nuclease [Aquabacterium sp.]|uniref:ATP-dependent nuclease n=1 Tax=Aquabacterium sp. TaxID=1872578 RepID=UPI00403780DB